MMLMIGCGEEKKMEKQLDGGSQNLSLSPTMLRTFWTS